jgi:hypothetical protein
VFTIAGARSNYGERWRMNIDLLMIIVLAALVLASWAYVAGLTKL